MVPSGGFEKGHRPTANWVKNGAKEELARSWVLGKRPSDSSQGFQMAEDPSLFQGDEGGQRSLPLQPIHTSSLLTEPLLPFPVLALFPWP